MRAVFLDGEQVDFQGEAPASAAAVWSVVESFLGGQGRAIEWARVDGVAWSPDAGDDRLDFARMELRSASLASQLAALSRQWIDGRARLVGEMDGLSRHALCHRWADTLPKALALFDSLGPAMQGVALLLDFGQRRGDGWATSLGIEYGRCVEAFEAVAQATQEGDCARLSDALALDLAPAWDRLIAEVEGAALEALERDG